MSARITAPASATSLITKTGATDEAKDPKAAAAAKKSQGLADASREFEAIFVRSMLKSSGIGGKDAGYGDMAIDSVAKSVTAGHGLGLGELIRRAVEKAESAAKSEIPLKVLK